MNILFYIILFIIGIGIGSVWSIKSNEIPKNLDLKKVHYSNNKNEELMSKLSYILIGGVSAVILANILKIHIYEFDFSKIIIYIFAMLYISTLVLVAGIDKIYLKVEKGVIAFGIISSIMYMVYLCMVNLASIYLNVTYLAIYMVLLLIDSFLLRRYAKDSYIINILLLLMIILVFTDLKTLTYTVVMALIAIILYALLVKKQKKAHGNKNLKINEIPIGHFIAASNVIVLFMIRIFESYCI